LESLRPIRPRAGTGPLGGPLVHLRRTGSTNDAARDAARRGATSGAVFVAEEQEAGRGRQGRTWVSAPGHSLTLSAIARAEPDVFPLLPLVTAVAVCEAGEAAAPVSCRIKWPNDVLIEGRKVSGILIESRPQERWAVIGIGLNVDTETQELDPELRATATSLRIAGGRPVDRDAALAELLDRFAEWTRATQERVVDAFRERDALLGKRISFTAAGTEMDGEAAGVDGGGNLVVFSDAGERLVLDAGEVHLLVR
jgi:BirA family transcriptional regulator, biotin operon repressor / biotin---[acetyl-CoA-carboxylase] ligase